MPKRKEIDIDILIKEYLKEGATTRSVAKILREKYGIKTTYKTIYDHLSKCDNEEVLNKMVENKQKIFNHVKFDIDKLIQEFLSGETTISLGEKYDCSDETIRRHLIKSGNIEVIVELANRVGAKNKQFREIISKIICVLECLHCGEKIVIKERFYTHKNCKCGKNIIFFCTPNFLNCKMLYKSNKMKSWCLKSFDEYKDD